MKHFICTLILCLFGFISISRAQAERTFISGDLSKVAVELAGSDQNWPLVASLAQYSASNNSFTLSPQAQSQLRTFLQNWRTMQEKKTKQEQLVRGGATVFAAITQAKADTLQKKIREEINRGDIVLATRLAGEYSELIDQMEVEVRTNRIADVEARLAEMTGTVQRRQGLIGSWSNVLTGSFFKNSDGVRTMQNSIAKLSFIDGSDIIIVENSTAIIRQASIDRLTNTAEVEISVTDGGLLARLSANAVQSSNYVVNAGNASMEVRSTNFYTERSSDDVVTVSNFTGSSVITAENVSIELQENQGTVVVAGREPSPPIPLLPSPRLPWAGSDSVVIDDQIVLRWNTLEGARQYEVETSPTSSFDRGNIVNRVSQNNFTVRDLPVGTTFIRLRGIDAQGLRGIDSPTYRVLRNLDLIPPAIILVNGNPRQLYTDTDQVTIEGVTEPGSTLYIGESRVPVGSGGEFRHVHQVGSELTSVQLQATDRAGNRTTELLSIIKIEESRLFNLVWSSPINDNVIRRTPRLGVSGRGYEPLEVVVEYNGNRVVTPMGISGQWALDFPTQGVNTFTLIFRYKNGGSVIAERTYKID